jgi:uncharacterized lipoprotein YmbA
MSAMMKYSPATSFICAAIFCAALLAGCSGGDAQTRYRVSGEVKFNGEPVQYGEVLFTPDGAQGNSGAQGIAEIKNGRYDTQGSRAPGVAGGPTVVVVTALQDDRGTLLIEHEFRIDLPKADTTHDFDIPAPTSNKKGVPEI